MAAEEDQDQDPNDYTRRLHEWAETEFDPDEATAALAGMLVGIALAMRHPDYATQAYQAATVDYMIRIAGSILLYDAQCVAAGEHRTAPQQLADELAHKVALSADGI